MPQRWEVIVCSEDEYDPQTGYYLYDARCGHKHKTQEAAQACCDKLSGDNPRCKTCEWDEDGGRILCFERCAQSVWIYGMVRPVNDPNRPRVPNFVPPPPPKRMTPYEFVSEFLSPRPPKYDWED